MEYHKIQTVLKRDPDTNYKTLISDEYSLPEFEYLSDSTWEFTEKIDGTNIRVLWKNGSIEFGGKTDRAQLPAKLVTRLQSLFSKTEMLKVFPDCDAILYGEGYGAGIQNGGKYIPDGVDFILFDVWCGGLWLTRESVEDIAGHLSIRCTPILDYGNLLEMILLAKFGFPSKVGDCEAEGIVARPTTELRTRRGDRIITKIKCSDFYS